MKKNKQFFILPTMGMKNRLFVQTVLFASIVLIFALIIVNVFMNDIYLHAAKREMRSTADDISHMNYYSKSFFSDIAEYESAKNYYIEIYDCDELIYTSQINNTSYSSYLWTEEIEEEITPKSKQVKTIKLPEFTDKYDFFSEVSEMNSRTRYLTFYHLNFKGTEDENDFFAIEIFDSLDMIENNAKIAKNYITGFLAVLAIVTIVSIIIYENELIKPLIVIIEGTKRLAKFEFDEKLPEFRIDELNVLSESVNTVSSALDMALTDLKEKNLQLEKDIENEKSLEKIKSEFISNASHELKTPIAIIQGYAEGLKLGISEGEAREEYCDIIIDEAGKMNNLVINLMEISKYESGYYPLKKTRFNIEYAVKSKLKSSVALLKEKRNITLCININPKYNAYADVEKIDTVINNYVSNAVSHVSGNNLIMINCTDTGEKYRISVFNTGSNIADEDIDKIWDSFYRADKAHSRASGRFGLGLSFVQSIQNLHGNKYGVINRENGVEFWFDVDKAWKKDY